MTVGRPRAPARRSARTEEHEREDRKRIIPHQSRRLLLAFRCYSCQQVVRRAFQEREGAKGEGRAPTVGMPARAPRFGPI